MAADFTLIE